MNEQEPTLRLNLGNDREFEMTPYNSTLFTFMGKTALNGIEFDNANVNHIFLQTGEETEAAMIGTYIFSNAEHFNTIAAFMVDSEFPLVLNRRDVPECDWNAYRTHVEQRAAAEAEEIGDFLPDDWLGDSDAGGN